MIPGRIIVCSRIALLRAHNEFAKKKKNIIWISIFRLLGWMVNIVVMAVIVVIFVISIIISCVMCTLTFYYYYDFLFSYTNFSLKLLSVSLSQTFNHCEWWTKSIKYQMIWIWGPSFQFRIIISSTFNSNLNFVFFISFVAVLWKENKSLSV